MDTIRIALAGNQNSGKTTLFNALTGSNQFVGNWPGVTVEKKEGKVKKFEGVTVTDLPGIYSLSPYTMEEVVSRNYLIDERPEVILNIVDAANLERNLYLTTQLMEVGIPVVIALNMIDVVRKNGDKIDVEGLSKKLGVKIVEISALKGEGLDEAVQTAIEVAKTEKTVPEHFFSGVVEHALAHIEEAVVHNLPEERQRWYAVKVFERDEKVIKSIGVSEEVLSHVEQDIVRAEKELDDDAESIITNERYVYITDILKDTYKRKRKGLSTSDKIDKIVTNRFLALPIFAVIMFLVYFLSVSFVGGFLTDWVNDGVFGDGWHLFGIGTNAYNQADEEYSTAFNAVNAYIDENGLTVVIDNEADDFDLEEAKNGLISLKSEVTFDTFTYELENEENLNTETYTVTLDEFKAYLDLLCEKDLTAPDPADFGVYVLGIPVIIEKGLEKINCWGWLSALILDGIVAGVGAVLGFLPQIFVLFIFLSFLEACGYMSRIAFVLDKIFRKFGLSGKSFIPILVGTGCGVPGIMASRTIENERDRRMTVITTTFIPCGAKLPFIALIAGVVFGGAWWVAPMAYFIGIFSIVTSGIILKKTKKFLGDVSPFVMELPAYHLPSFYSVMHCTWERTWSFIKKAGSIILLSTIVVWFLSNFGFVDGAFKMLEDSTDKSLLAYIGKAFSWLFVPIGFGSWQATVASFTGILAKENIVGTMSVLYGGASGFKLAFGKISAFSFMIFNLICVPCFSAIGAMNRELNSRKWLWFAIGYQCGFAYVLSFMFYNFARFFSGAIFGNGTKTLVLGLIGVVLAVLMLCGFIYMLCRSEQKVRERLQKKKE